jgi:hypothetical protein
LFRNIDEAQNSKVILSHLLNVFVPKPFAEKRAAAFVALVDRLHVTGLQPAHEIRKIAGLLRLQHEMKMIWHQAIGNDIHRKNPEIFVQQAEEIEIVLRFEEDFLPVGATMIDVVILTGLKFLVARWHFDFSLGLLTGR